jgi:hypothetical protein
MVRLLHVRATVMRTITKATSLASLLTVVSVGGCAAGDQSPYWPGSESDSGGTSSGGGNGSGASGDSSGGSISAEAGTDGAVDSGEGGHAAMDSGGGMDASSSTAVLGVNYVGAVSTYLPAFKSVGISAVRVFALYQSNLETLLASFAAQNIRPLLVLDEATTVNGAPQYCHQSKSQTVNTDQQIVQAFLQAYGSNYEGWFEFGNEPNTSPGNCGYTVAQYVAGWNAVIPQLRAMAPNAWFGGPALPNTDAAYVTAFVQQAKPAPDFVSWHLYAGSNSWSTSQLQSSWQGWPNQIAQIDGAVQSALGHHVPSMITEWNYAWDGGVGPDSRVTPLSTSSFAATFAQQVLGEFQSAGVYAHFLFDDSGFPSPVGTTTSDPSFGLVTPMGLVY